MFRRIGPYSRGAATSAEDQGEQRARREVHAVSPP
jgi:hypothetical protein